jgi:hypothetical protein
MDPKDIRLEGMAEDWYQRRDLVNTVEISDSVKDGDFLISERLSASQK